MFHTRITTFTSLCFTLGLLHLLVCFTLGLLHLQGISLTRIPSSTLTGCNPRQTGRSIDHIDLQEIVVDYDPNLQSATTINLIHKNSTVSFD